jgi:hypothetical protein
LFSQIIYEKGHYLNNSGEQVECLIKNYGWKNNPSEIEIKKDDNDSSTTLKIGEITAFEVVNGSRYIRAKTRIDRSADQVSYLDENREPNWSEETVLLKLLVEGEKPLYYFEDTDITRFFFVNSKEEIEQLVYKRYKVYDKKNGAEVIKTNFKFRQQLWEDARIENYPSQKLKSLSYQKNDLLKYFHNLNGFDEEASVKFRSKLKWRTDFRLIAGLNSSSIELSNSSSSEMSIKFDNEYNSYFGVQTEFISPYNNGKWSILIEPTYYSVKSEKTVFKKLIVSTEKRVANIDYKTIQMPVGVRHYSFLSNDKSIFFNALYVPNLVIALDDKIAVEYFDADTEVTKYEKTYNIDPNFSFILGFGFNYKRWSAELRYYTNRELLSDYTTYSSDYSRFGINLSYKLF